MVNIVTLSRSLKYKLEEGIPQSFQGENLYLLPISRFNSNSCTFFFIFFNISAKLCYACEEIEFFFPLFGKSALKWPVPTVTVNLECTVHEIPRIQEYMVHAIYTFTHRKGCIITFSRKNVVTKPEK